MSASTFTTITGADWFRSLTAARERSLGRQVRTFAASTHPTFTTAGGLAAKEGRGDRRSQGVSAGLARAGSGGGDSLSP